VGVITDVVVAKTSDAAKACEDVNSDEFVWKEMRGLSVDSLIWLYSLISKTRVTKRLYKDYPELYCGETGEGPWATKISDDLVKLLSKLTDRSIPELAEKWIETASEWNDPRPPSVERAKEALETLRSLSKEAIRRKKSLLLRVCL
jgi:hypothetical protein